MKPAPPRLGKSARIRKHREYQRVQQGGQRLKLPHFVFVLQARAVTSSARLGITASRKVGCAVVRNRVKRLVREAFRQTHQELFPNDIDVVVIVRHVPDELGLASVIAEWRASAKPLRTRIEYARRTRDAVAPDAAASAGPEPPARC